jgi:hypothetical protein
MKKEWFLLLGTTVATVVLAIAVIRWYAPTLLGLPPDLQMVQTSKKVVPFFDSVFRVEDYASQDFILKDPIIMRAKPLFPDVLSMGPNDLLGFRNRSIPNRAEVVIIGDSQTYGNNALLEESWPGWFAHGYATGPDAVYSMAVGGWGAAEYFEIFDMAMAFEPETIVVAFYTGNDPLDSLRVFSKDRWSQLRPNGLDSVKAPKVDYPPTPKTSWPVKFSDGIETVFTPLYRFGSNQDHPGVDAGYEVMALVAERLKSKADKLNVHLVFTIIPTKELVYRKRIEKEGIEVPGDYRRLVDAETARIAWMERKLSESDLEYVNVVKPLQEAALQEVQLYPPDGNGHPIGSGYKVIANVLLSAVPGTPVEDGLVATRVDNDDYIFGLVRSGTYHAFQMPALVQANGWSTGEVPLLDRSVVTKLRHGRVIDHVNKHQFGPD